MKDHQSQPPTKSKTRNLNYSQSIELTMMTIKTSFDLIITVEEAAGDTPQLLDSTRDFDMTFRNFGTAPDELSRDDPGYDDDSSVENSMMDQGPSNRPPATSRTMTLAQHLDRLNAAQHVAAGRDQEHNCNDSVQLARKRGIRPREEAPDDWSEYEDEDFDEEFSIALAGEGNASDESHIEEDSQVPPSSTKGVSSISSPLRLTPRLRKPAPSRAW